MKRCDLGVRFREVFYTSLTTPAVDTHEQQGTTSCFFGVLSNVISCDEVNGQIQVSWYPTPGSLYDTLPLRQSFLQVSDMWVGLSQN